MRSLEDSLPYLFGLLGIVEDDDPLVQMDPEIRRQRTYEALKRVLIRREWMCCNFGGGGW